MRLRKLLLGILAAAMACLSEPIFSAGAVAADEMASYRIEFLGNDPPNDWARLATALIERNLVPIKTAEIDQKVGPCGTMLGLLGFRTARLGCTSSMEGLLLKLNAKSPAVEKTDATSLPSRTATQFAYPDLPIEEMTYSQSFDRMHATEEDRYNKAVSSRKTFAADEINRGAQTQVVFRGFRTKVAIPDREENDAFLRSLQRYDQAIGRRSVRVVPLGGGPALKSFNSASPDGWFSDCRQKISAVTPKPHYASLLGLSVMPACAMKCAGDNCPEIVLVDGKAAPHPHIVGSIPDPEPPVINAAGAPQDEFAKLCPWVAYNKTEHHGTHLAGIIFSANQPDSFVGLAPAARLDTRAFDKMTEWQLGDVVAEKAYDGLRLFVFASNFLNGNTVDPLPDLDERLRKPFFIEDIRDGEKLWVVAAGNSTINIQPNSRLSPMNIGDLRNVLVVTACEDCFTRNAKVADWANYSTAGLVALAAPGGTLATGIPSTASSSQYAVTYGTSQAAAIVGGLAGAMMTCFPDRYRNTRELKVRLQSAVHPPASSALARKVSTGVVNADKALKDPGIHHVQVKSEAVKRVKGLQWCRDKIEFIDPVSRRPLEGGGIDPRRIRHLVRDEIPDTGPVWYAFYEPVNRANAIVKRYGPGLLVGTQPLLRVRYEEGALLSEPISINDVEFILSGFEGSNQVLPSGRC